MLDKGLRQQIVQRATDDEQFVVGSLVAEHRPLVYLGHGGLGEDVVRMGEQLHGLDDEAYRRRGIQPEGLVADDGHLRHLFGQVVGDEGDIPVGAYQNGHLSRCHTTLQQAGDGVAQRRQHLFVVVVVCRQQLDVDISVLGALLRNILSYVGIGVTQLFRARGVEFLLLFVFLAGGLSKEGVVEVDDVALGAVVGLQRQNVHHLVGMGELAVDGIQQPPVTGAPAVDALLDVANDEVLGVRMAHALLQQHLEVLPLHGGGVLELVYHDVLQLRAYLLEDEWRVAVLDERVQQLLRVAEQESVGLFVHQPHLPLDASQQPKLVEVAQDEVGRLEQPVLAGTVFHGLTEQGYQRRVRQGMNVVAVVGTLLVPLGGVALTVGNTCPHDAFVQLTIAQLVEESRHTRLAIGQVAVAETFRLQRVEEAVGILLHVLGCGLLDLPHLAHIAF